MDHTFEVEIGYVRSDLVAVVAWGARIDSEAMDNYWVWKKGCAKPAPAAPLDCRIVGHGVERSVLFGVTRPRKMSP